MAKTNEKRVAVTLECTSCKRRNYITIERDRLELSACECYETVRLTPE